MTALAMSADGQRLYAARRGAIDVIDAPTMTLKASIALGAKATGAALAISADATRAAVVLDAKRIGVVDLVRFRLSRRAKLAGATGMTFAASGSNAYVATHARTARGWSASTPTPAGSRAGSAWARAWAAASR